MTIQSVTRDVRYPLPGATVQLTASYDEGTRCRFRLLSKPHDSKLEVFDEARSNYLVRNQIVPDVPGTYIVEAEEVTETFETPRFSNDLGNASAHGGTVRGVETLTPVATLIAVPGGSVVGGRMRYALPVGLRVTRQIGFGDAAVSFACLCAGSHDTVETLIPIDWAWNPNPPPGHLEPIRWLLELRPATEGVISRYADRTLSPSLSPSSRALVNYAATTPATIAALTAIGGGTYGDAPGEDAPIIGWDSVIHDPWTRFAEVVAQVNAHIPDAVHAVIASAAELYSDAMPDNRDSFVTAVGTLGEVVARHLSNMSAASVPTGYHTSVDHSSILASLRSKPSSFDDAILTLETIAWVIGVHAAKGAPTHTAGTPRPAVTKLEAVAHAFLDGLQTPLPASPGGNENVASLRLAAAGWGAAS